MSSNIGPDDVARDLQQDMNERVDRLMLPPLPERRRLRVDADLSVEAMAHLLGVSRPTVQKWEDGTGGPTSANRVMYAAVLQRLAHHELVAADE